MTPAFNILYLGHNYGTSRHRAEALRRLGNKVELIDLWDFLPKIKIIRDVIGKLIIETGAVWIEPYIQQRLLAHIKNRYFDVVWSDQCVFCGPTTTTALRNHSDYMVTYAIDDPFGTRDKNRFTLYSNSISLYDLVVVVREPNVAEAYGLGARNVMRVFRSADEIAHRPLRLTPEIEKRWASKVVFIGTWMPERGPFLARLLSLGIPLTLYGDRWHKANEWCVLKKVWKGPSLLDDAYSQANQAAKICIGLLSKGNRDEHTSRSVEIPYIGSLLCAKRTFEHLAMYRENEEAVFWRTPEECAAKCFMFLSDESRRKSVAKSGRARCLHNGYLNEPIMETVLNTLIKCRPCCRTSRALP